MWVSDWRLPTLREEMEEVLGPLAMFEVVSATAAEASPLSEPAAIAALSGADKLVIARASKWDTTMRCRRAGSAARLWRWARPSPAVSRRSGAAGALGPVDDQAAQSGAGGGGGVAGNPGSLLPASGIWQPRIRAILVAYSI